MYCLLAPFVFPGRINGIWDYGVVCGLLGIQMEKVILAVEDERVKSRLNSAQMRNCKPSTWYGQAGPLIILSETQSLHLTLVYLHGLLFRSTEYPAGGGRRGRQPLRRQYITSALEGLKPRMVRKVLHFAYQGAPRYLHACSRSVVSLIVSPFAQDASRGCQSDWIPRIKQDID